MNIILPTVSESVVGRERDANVTVNIGEEQWATKLRNTTLGIFST